MRCSRCGECCKETEMLLSRNDISRLEKRGYASERFVRYDRQGYARLRNRGGCCVFYDVEKGGCRVYRCRPEGCRVYPVVFSEEEGIVIDDICSARSTIQPEELRQRGNKVVKLLRKIDCEAAIRRAGSSQA